jgi:phage head maturation protease
MERKTFRGINLKAEKEGTFTARIATLNVIDKDGDVTIPGAFPEGKEILLSAYQHGSWMGGLPVGKGMIHEDGDDVIVDGEFNLKTQTGREHYETAKFAPHLQEWSYGFEVKSADTDSEWEGEKVNRILKTLDVFEASQVLLGAGIDTGILAIKNEKQTYADHADIVLAAVSDLIDRTKSLADLRRKEGRVLSSANRDRMKKLLSSLSEVATDLKQLLDATEPDNGKSQLVMLSAIKEKIHYMEAISQ